MTMGALVVEVPEKKDAPGARHGRRHGHDVGRAHKAESCYKT
jgi:hypothetical protein